MSDIIVQKFGGTSVGSDERISAVAQIIKNAKKDNQHASIILSPAAASFDQYKNFETRGNAFKRIVSNL